MFRCNVIHIHVNKERKFSCQKALRVLILIELLKRQRADDKILVCKISKNVSPKLYHTENSKNRGQIVYAYDKLRYLD